MKWKSLLSNSQCQDMTIFKPVDVVQSVFCLVKCVHIGKPANDDSAFFAFCNIGGLQNNSTEWCLETFDPTLKCLLKYL